MLFLYVVIVIIVFSSFPLNNRCDSYKFEEYWTLIVISKKKPAAAHQDDEDDSKPVEIIGKIQSSFK